ncbi:hypothetical protein MTO96_015681 [Rhipicephalus appendiculatus]
MELGIEQLAIDTTMPLRMRGGSCVLLVRATCVAGIDGDSISAVRGKRGGAHTSDSASASQLNAAAACEVVRRRRRTTTAERVPSLVAVCWAGGRQTGWLPACKPDALGSAQHSLQRTTAD